MLFVRGNKIYKGNGSCSSDVLFNISSNKVYKGNGSCSSDVICNIRNGKVYEGNGSCSSDVNFRIDGDVTIEEFVAIWYAVNYCW